MNVLVCGGFGFAGHYVVYKLLQDGHKVIIFGRSKNDQTVENRIQQLVDDNLLVNDKYKVDSSSFKNLSFIDGDLSKPNLGITEMEYKKLIENGINEIYNMAAFLRYEEEYRDDLMAINVDGTHNLLKLALQTSSRYIHASTTYIADKDHPNFKPIPEDFCLSTNFSNVYIESKCRAEILIKDFCLNNNVVFFIFRFPTLIGDSKTGFTNSSFGFYEYINAINVLKSRCNKNESIRVKAIPDGTINLLPTDIVIDYLFKICIYPENKNKIYNIADPQPLSPNKMSEIIGQIFGLNVIAIDDLTIDKSFSINEKLFSRLTRKNTGFVTKAYIFDCSNSEKALGHSIAKNWDKSINYFEKLRDGYTTFVTNN